MTRSEILLKVSSRENGLYFDGPSSLPSSWRGSTSATYNWLEKVVDVRLIFFNLTQFWFQRFGDFRFFNFRYIYQNE